MKSLKRVVSSMIVCVFALSMAMGSYASAYTQKRGACTRCGTENTSFGYDPILEIRVMFANIVIKLFQQGKAIFILLSMIGMVLSVKGKSVVICHIQTGDII